MNLKDFYTALTNISQVLDQKDLATLYTQLVNALTNFQNTPNNEAQTQINDAINAIVSRNNEILQSFTRIPHSEFVVDHLKISEYVSENISEVISGLLINERHTAIDQLTKTAQGINNLRNKIKTLNTQFADIDIELATEDRSFLSIEFGGRQSPATTAELRKRLEDIESIFRAFARLTDDPTSLAKPRIQSISKSSPLVMDIAAATAAVKTPATIVLIAKSVEWLMNRMQQGIEIKLKLQELKNAQLVSAEREPEFDKVFENQIEDLTADPEVKVFVETLYEETDHPDTNGAAEEIKKDVKEAIELLHKYLEANSAIRPYILPSAGDEDVITGEEAANITLQTNLGYMKLEIKKEELKALESGRQTAEPDPTTDEENA